MNIRKATETISAELNEISEDHLLEARLIIQKATGLSRPVLLSHPERELSPLEWDAIREMSGKRLQGVPLPYLLGEWGFYGHQFHVDPSVLIPRPETELLVDEALAWLKHHPHIRTGFDIGTGSGCIAIAMLLALPDMRMTVVDIKRDALQTAMGNARRYGCADRFFPVQADLFSAFTGDISLICANLPYIPSRTCLEIEPARYEPLSALDGGEDGFCFYRLLFDQIANKINKESLILCEIEYRQRELALRTAETFFPERSIHVLDDLAGLPRLLRIS